MSAKEMFEGLGFRCEEQLNLILYSQLNYLKDDEEQIVVVFYKDSFPHYYKISTNKPTSNGFISQEYTRVDMLLLQAINKQVEELGWNK